MMMKSLASLLLLCTTLSVAIADVTTSDNQLGMGCNFQSIQYWCGPIPLHSIDDSVYGFHPLLDWKVNVMNKVGKYAKKLESGDPRVEGSDNPEVALSYAFMHYICFDPLIQPGEEHKIYECLLKICPRIEGSHVEQWCEGVAETDEQILKAREIAMSESHSGILP